VSIVRQATGKPSYKLHLYVDHHMPPSDEGSGASHHTASEPDASGPAAASTARGAFGSGGTANAASGSGGRAVGSGGLANSGNPPEVATQFGRQQQQSLQHQQETVSQRQHASS
jgi:hypothetical protein